ncbi:MgtC/SapB family protein [Anaerococcus hydrogenalis]|uniref:MgtC/SapB family protein n=1 Tax=Anaerococcus hydrogenalis TaxID=33029 RepID=UPI001D8BF62F|nr:MgtC/SapB family protein [Anaerococcus hydrogenalis]MBS5989211.1 MgtC/SapB family protein [Anaerococcus hydrogenalis]
MENLRFIEILVARLFLSCFIGVMIGLEREFKGKFAGIRTHTIVALGSALAMIVSKYGFFDSSHYDAQRIAAQVVSGIGFLGGGLIFIKKDYISGLRTAAGIWTTAIIGMSIGAGMYAVGITASLVILLLQLFFNEDYGLFKFMKKPYTLDIVLDGPESIEKINKYLKSQNIKFVEKSINYKEDKLILELQYHNKNEEELIGIIDFLRENKRVFKFSLD